MCNVCNVCGGGEERRKRGRTRSLPPLPRRTHSRPLFLLAPLLTLCRIALSGWRDRAGAQSRQIWLRGGPKSCAQT
eukprot:1277886-Rhodomonas_salina.1